MYNTKYIYGWRMRQILDFFWTPIDYVMIFYLRIICTDNILLATFKIKTVWGISRPYVAVQFAG